MKRLWAASQLRAETVRGVCQHPVKEYTADQFSAHREKRCFPAAPTTGEMLRAFVRKQTSLECRSEKKVKRKGK
jgi:hypothetical protein